MPIDQCTQCVVNTQSISKLHIMALQQRKFSKVKIAILGASGVGKTALAVRYLTKRFIGEYDSNKEMLYTHKTLVDGTELSVDLLDTATDGGDASLETHIKWADGFILIYSVADPASLARLEHYHNIITHARHHDEDVIIPMVVLGNKIDQSLARKVSDNDGKSMASKCNAWWGETSVAESKDGVVGAIEELIRQVKRELAKHNESVKKSTFPNMKKVFKKKIARSRSDSFFR